MLFDKFVDLHESRAMELRQLESLWRKEAVCESSRLRLSAQSSPHRSSSCKSRKHPHTGSRGTNRPDGGIAT